MGRLFAITLSLSISAAFQHPALAQSDAGITLSPGESITVTTDPDRASGFEVLDRAPARLSRYDEASVELFLRGAMDHAVGPVAEPMAAGEMGLPVPPEVTSGMIRITFAAVAEGRETVLLIENGYDRAFIYRAVINRDGQSRPTDVCTVMPGIRGHEHWPYDIDSIALTGFRLEPWNESQGIRCE